MRNESKEWHDNLILRKTQAKLADNGFQVKIFDEPTGAKETLLEMLSETDQIGLGGSTTVREIGLYQELVEGDYPELLNPYETDISREEQIKRRKRAMLSDVFVSGSNAITLDGKLVNMDGLGNRVASITFGPEKVFIIAGKNKIVKDVHAGIERIKRVAAPINAKRLNLSPPCVKTGVCEDCNHPDRICNHLVVTEKASKDGRITVLLVDEKLGF